MISEEIATLISSAFGLTPNELTIGHVAKAIAAFERTLISNDSAFDRFLYGRDQAALSQAAIRGLELFRGRAECSGCHSIEEREAQLTDHQFHSLGVSFERVASRLADITQRVSAADARALDQMIGADADIAELGRFAVTKDPRDIGKFRTPSLRNVALTAPYMHDGSVSTLAAAIDSEVYYRSLERDRPLILTPRERADVVAFLQALTSDNAQDPLSTSRVKKAVKAAR
jgi:cytochrome c peroxidase